MKTKRAIVTNAKTRIALGMTLGLRMAVLGFNGGRGLTPPVVIPSCSYVTNFELIVDSVSREVALAFSVGFQ